MTKDCPSLVIVWTAALKVLPSDLFAKFNEEMQTGQTFFPENMPE